MSLIVGMKLGAYEVLSPLGAGGMGEVWKARDTRLERMVALKVLPEEFFEDKEWRERFEREAKALAALNHPNIAAIYSFEEIPGSGGSSGRHLLVMELLEGETLAERLSRGPLPLEQVLRLGFAIASALDSAHRAGIVHRDLKPGNVMLTRSGVKLLDFGLAKFLAREGPVESLTSAQTAAKDVTREGVLLGTLPYMAPEQLEGRKADSRTDIFAFGALLYEMATGKKAFRGDTQASLISAIMTGDPQPISALQPMTPAALDRLVRTCLAKDPDDRWQASRDVALQLRDVPAGQDKVPPTRPRRTAISFLLGVLLVTVAGLTLLVLRSRRPSLDSEPVVFSVAPPTRSPFSSQPGESSFAVSPDGRNLTFVARNENGQDALWVRSM